MSVSRSEFKEEGYSVYELEAKDSPGSHKYNVTIGQDVSAVLVHVEGTNETQVHIGEQEIVDRDKSTYTHKSKNSAVFLKIKPPYGKSESINVKVEASIPKGSRLRVTILVLFKKFREFTERLSCKGCKKLLRGLISLILSSMGIPAWLESAELSAKAAELLESLIDEIAVPLPTAIRELLNNFDSTVLKKILGAAKHVLSVANFVVEPIDIFFEKICIYLGYCEQAETPQITEVDLTPPMVSESGSSI